MDAAQETPTFDGYELTMRTSSVSMGPCSTISSMFSRFIRSCSEDSSWSQIRYINFWMFRSSFCEMRLHVL